MAPNFSEYRLKYLFKQLERMVAMKIKILGMALGILLMFFGNPPVHSQELKEIYVSEGGTVLGAIFYFDPGYPSYALVNSAGVLVWLNMEIPGAMLEIDTAGRIKLLERISPGTISYSYGQISQIGDLRLEYDAGRIKKIGNLSFGYDQWKLAQVGNMPIVIKDGLLQSLGAARFEYEVGRLRKINDLAFTYQTGRVERIGQVQLYYEYGSLRKMTGEIPGVLVKISSIVDFRRSLR